MLEFYLTNKPGLEELTKSEALAVIAEVMEGFNCSDIKVRHSRQPPVPHASNYQILTYPPTRIWSTKPPLRLPDKWRRTAKNWKNEMPTNPEGPPLQRFCGNWKSSQSTWSKPSSPSTTKFAVNETIGMTWCTETKSRPSSPNTSPPSSSCACNSPKLAASQYRGPSRLQEQNSSNKDVKKLFLPEFPFLQGSASPSLISFPHLLPSSFPHLLPSSPSHLLLSSSSLIFPSSPLLFPTNQPTRQYLILCYWTHVILLLVKYPVCQEKWISDSSPQEIDSIKSVEG